MSGTTFLSSPLRPLNPSQYRNIFYTPQHKTSWNSAYAPPSPSPLKALGNAHVMSSPPTWTGLDQGGDENAGLETQDESAFGTFSFNSGDTSTSFGASTTPESVNNLSTPFLFGSKAPSATESSTRATQFQFQARASASTPTVQLRNQTASNRDSRKRLFLDRLRNKRDDERFERSGDQVLRLDWVKEQKAREEEMRRRETQEMGMIEEDVMETGEWEQKLDEMSPTEDREIEELVSYLEEKEDEFSDEDYDALFMEVMSRETPGQTGGITRDMGEGALRPSPHDADMDMS